MSSVFVFVERAFDLVMSDVRKHVLDVTGQVLDPLFKSFTSYLVEVDIKLSLDEAPLHISHSRKLSPFMALDMLIFLRRAWRIFSSTVPRAIRSTLSTPLVLSRPMVRCSLCSLFSKSSLDE